MKLNKFLIVLIGGLLCINCYHLQAQPKSSKFGKVEKRYVEMESYEREPDAGAVVLFDYCNVYIDLIGDKARLIYEYHKRIKILSDAEVELANFSIPFYSYRDIEEIAALKGVTHNMGEDGKIVSTKMTKADVFDEDLGGRRTIKKLTLPQVKKGSVIEIAYKKFTYDFQFIETNYFQSSYPTIYSEFVMNVPEGFDYQPRFYGEMINLERKTGNYASGILKGTNTKFIGRDIPAFVKEPYSSTFKNYVSRLDYQLAAINRPGNYQNFSYSWEKYNSQLLADDDFQGNLKPTKYISDLTEEALAKRDHNIGEVEGLIEFVRNEIAWNDYFGIYNTSSFKKIVEERKGSAQSRNFLLGAMLNSKGYEVYPVLISTRNHGAIRVVDPSLWQFNHVILLVKDKDGNERLLDVNSSQGPFDLLPFMDLNNTGLIISTSGPKWIDIKSSNKWDESITIAATLSPEGVIAAEFSIQDKGYAASHHRTELKKDHDLDEKAYITKRIVSKMADGNLETHNLQNTNEYSNPFITQCSITTSDYTNVSGDYIYLQPLMNKRIEENPFTQEKRTYPVDFGYGQKKRYLFNLRLPEGYVVEEIPQAIRMVLPDKSASFSYQAQAIGPNLQLLTEIKIDKPYFSTEEYDLLKQFYDQVVKKQGEQIVLKKQ